VPVYEYECSRCRCRFERRQGFDEEPVGLCPRCRGRVRRVIHSVPIVFKGSGFYTTDYPRDPGTGRTRNKGAKEEKGESPTPERAKVESTASEGK